MLRQCGYGTNKQGVLGSSITAATIAACSVDSYLFDASRDHLPGHSYTYKSPAKREAAAAAVDLSNATFTALEDQIEGLNEIKVLHAHNSMHSVANCTHICSIHG